MEEKKRERKPKLYHSFLNIHKKKPKRKKINVTHTKNENENENVSNIFIEKHTKFIYFSNFNRCMLIQI